MNMLEVVAPQVHLLFESRIEYVYGANRKGDRFQAACSGQAGDDTARSSARELEGTALHDDPLK